MQKFTMTAQHLKLLRHMRVGWQDCETGAPEINPKRPYGNSAVMNDIHEILTGEHIACVGCKRDELTDEEIQRYEVLHRETKTALQVVLTTGSFQSGEYVANEYTNNWHLVRKEH